ATGESGYTNVAGATTLQAGTGAGDHDGDGVDDLSDNCPTVPNPSQANADGDALGDACEDERMNANVAGSGVSGNRIDGAVLFVLLRGFGSHFGDAHFDPLVDLDRNLSIDGSDLAILAAVWAEEVP